MKARELPSSEIAIFAGMVVSNSPRLQEAAWLVLQRELSQDKLEAYRHVRLIPTRGRTSLA